MAKKDWRRDSDGPSKASLRAKKKHEQKVKSMLKEIEIENDDELFENEYLKKNFVLREN